MQLRDLQMKIQSNLLEGGSFDQPSHQHLSIYQNGYYERVADALAQDFPLLFEFMGEGAFSSLSRSYIDLYPSLSATLHFLGQNLLDFLNARCDSHPAILELVRFEGALLRVRYAQNVSPLTVDGLKESDADTITLTLHPAALLFCDRFGVVQRWLADAPLVLDGINENDCCYLLWRTKDGVGSLQLDDKALFLVEQLAESCSIAGLLDGFTSQFGEEGASQYVTHFFSMLVQGRILTKLSI